MQLGVAEYVVGDEDVVESGVGHHLSFSELLTSDPYRPGVDLHARNLRQLMGLDMRPIHDTVFIEVSLQPINVRLNLIQVYEDARRVEFFGRHTFLLFAFYCSLLTSYRITDHRLAITTYRLLSSALPPHINNFPLHQSMSLSYCFGKAVDEVVGNGNKSRGRNSRGIVVTVTADVITLAV